MNSPKLVPVILCLCSTISVYLPRITDEQKIQPLVPKLKRCGLLATIFHIKIWGRHKKRYIRLPEENIKNEENSLTSHFKKEILVLKPQWAKGENGIPLFFGERCTKATSAFATNFFASNGLKFGVFLRTFTQLGFVRTT